MDISLLYYIGTLALALACFFIGQKSSAENAELTKGAMLAEISFLKSELTEIKQILRESKDYNNQKTQDLRTDLTKAIERLHTRIDNHEENFHSTTQ